MALTLSDGKRRCEWANTELLQQYHDIEWGYSPQNDASWFEAISLEAFQSGLSWRIVLEKRDALRTEFFNFNPRLVCSLLPADIERMMSNQNIIRHRAKLSATVANAFVACERMHEYGSLQNWVNFHLSRSISELYRVLTTSFRFVGPTTATSILQATGCIQPPHEANCYLCSTLR